VVADAAGRDRPAGIAARDLEDIGVVRLVPDLRRRCSSREFVTDVDDLALGSGG
jgi:hypothetical protein